MNKKEKLIMYIENYVICKKIGKGSFGIVYLGIHILTKEKVAIKVLDKNTINDTSDFNRISREIFILKMINHSNIIKLYECFEDDTNIYLILEYCEQGEYYELLKKKKKLNELESSTYFLQIISAIEYIHKLNITHRDLKPENILLSNNKIKLIDFGWGNIYNNEEKLNTACGSPCYAPPEMIKGVSYDGLKADLWSAGVILYSSLCGKLPFEEPNMSTEEIYNKIMFTQIKYWNNISKDGNDLLNKILEKDPNKRISIEEIYSHPFITKNNNKIDNIKGKGIIFHKDKVPVDEAIINNIEKEYNFKKENIIKNLESNIFNQETTIYYLLLKKKLMNNNPSIYDICSKNFKSEFLDKKISDKKSSSKLASKLSKNLFKIKNLVGDIKLNVKEKKIEKIKLKLNLNDISKLDNSKNRQIMLSNVSKKITEKSFKKNTYISNKIINSEKNRLIKKCHKKINDNSYTKKSIKNKYKFNQVLLKNSKNVKVGNYLKNIFINKKLN